MEDEMQSHNDLLEAKVSTLNSKVESMDGQFMNIAHLLQNLTTSLAILHATIQQQP
jgi:chaperonin cofactor prefoldin